jgi:hypothetical protein
MHSADYFQLSRFIHLVRKCIVDYNHSAKVLLRPKPQLFVVAAL